MSAIDRRDLAHVVGGVGGRLALGPEGVAMLRKIVTAIKTGAPLDELVRGMNIEGIKNMAQARKARLWLDGARPRDVAKLPK